MLIKSLATLLLLAATHIGAQASIISMTVYGIVATEAIDKSAMFGPINTNLMGQVFKATVSYERRRRTDLSNPDMDIYNADVTGAVPVDFSITINNRTLTRQFVPIQMHHIVMDSAHSFADMMWFDLWTGNVDGGVGFGFHIYNFENSLIGPLPRLETPLVYDVVDSDGPYGSVWLRPAGRSFGNLDFNSEITRVEVSSEGFEVPEPGSGLMMLGALAAVGMVRRRKGWNAVETKL